MAESNVVSAILELREREPFHSFAIVMTSGDRYTIDAPANLVEMKSDFFYARPDGETFVFIRKAETVAVEGSEGRQRPPTKRRRAS